MNVEAPVPITLRIERDHPSAPGPEGPLTGDARSWAERGERVEVIAESPDEEEFVELDAAGNLVHRVCPWRAYLGKLTPSGFSTELAFGIRAMEKALELSRLWNRSIGRLEDPGSAVPAALRNLLPLSRTVAGGPMRRWEPCRSASLICPTYNRVDELLSALESFLVAQAEASRGGIECEILVVYQNEGTRERVLARRPALSTAPLRWIRSSPGLPRARNVGLRHAVGDLLIFVDDDVLLDPGFVRGHLEAANAVPTSAGNAGRVRSRILGERGALNRAVGQIRLSAFVDTHFDSLTDAPIVPHTPIGANMAFKREAMQSIFGEAWFDERLEGSAHREETTLCVELFRRGGHLVFARDASLLHLEAEAGGCENRGALSTQQELDHLTLDYLFFRRFFRDLGPLAPLAPLSFLLREVRQAPPPRLRRLRLNLRAYLGGSSRYSREGVRAGGTDFRS